MTKKEKQLKDNIIRVNDIIKIINPTIFIRCGYPLELKKVTEMIGIEFYDTIKKFVQEVVKYDKPILKIKFTNPEKEFEDISRCLAYRYIRRHNFGGNKKVFYTLYVPELEDCFCMVEKIRMIRTGQYRPDCSSGPSQDGEYDYEPACLIEPQYHKILTVWNKDSCKLQLYPKDIIHNIFQIEAKRVEKVKDLENNPYRDFVR